MYVYDDLGQNAIKLKIKMRHRELHLRPQEYGLCIMDECCHAATITLIEVFQEVKAKYVYGVTATPMRSDGLEKIGHMLQRHSVPLYSERQDKGAGDVYIRELDKAVQSVRKTRNGGWII